MTERWYRNGMIYSLDIGAFQDSDSDGIGDLPGLVQRLNYLNRLGVDVVWLNPFHPSPRRDYGYDVTDHYGVDRRFGDLGDFAELLNHADGLGIRVMIDLVVNHTSDQHPWFQSARSDPASPWRDWYVWSASRPAELAGGPVFPGVERGTWSFDQRAGAWYRHRFYHFQPDLNTEHPAVRAEIAKIIAFWSRLGVAGFRIDAAPFVIQSRRHEEQYDYGLLRRIRETLSWRRGDAVLLAEANVCDEQLLEYFGQADGLASRAMMLFAFRLNQALLLALARQDARPVRKALRSLPVLPEHAQWATFLRNHDESDLGRLTPEERRDVFSAFGPEPEMQLYDRGIRRRLAPMLGGDHRRLELAYSLQLTMPGTPVLRYGDEIGMGENLSLPERDAIRTPMQWTNTANAGFSTCHGALIAPVIDDEQYGYRKVNVTAQRRDPHSLLTWFERVLHTRRECDEIGTGRHEVQDVGPHHVLVHRAHTGHGTMLFTHNLSARPCRLSLAPQPDADDEPLSVLADGEYDDDIDLRSLDLGGYGYRWIRLR